MKPEGGKGDAAPTSKANIHAAKLLRKSKKGALGRGKHVNTLVISNHGGSRHGPRHHHHRRHRSRRSLPPDCLALLQNRANFGRSAVPSRVMFFGNGSWTDFPSDATETLKQAFASGTLSKVVEIDGCSYLIDFLRMLQIDTAAGIGRSIAWIDVNGKCFFPQLFSGGDDGVFAASNPLKLEIEVKIKGGWKVDDDQSEAQSENGLQDQSCDRESRRIEPRKRIGDLGNRENSQAGKEIISRVPDLNRSENVEGNLGNSMVGKEIRARRAKDNVVVAVPCPERNNGGNGNSVNTKKENVVETNQGNVGGSGNLVNSETGMNRAPGKRVLEIAENPVRADDKDEMLPKRARATLLPELGTAIGTLAPVPSQGSMRLELTRSAKLVELDEGNRVHAAVKNLFLAGMRKIDAKTRVNSVYWCCHSSRIGNARLQAFQRNAAMMKDSRGNANVRYAWHGASSKVIESLVLHGFQQVEARIGLEAYGAGIYLSAEGYSQASASHAGADADGKFHVVLCRVILGNMEQMNLGSRQFQPTNEGFDSGVDNLRDPRLYIIWRGRMNTHIFPEYVVSFKVSEHLEDLWRRRRLAQGSCDVPTCISALREISNSSSPPVQAIFPIALPNPSIHEQGQRQERPPISDLMPNITFPMLFAGIRGHLPESSVKRLEDIYNHCKAGTIRKDVLVKAVRLIVGDKLLIAAVHNFSDRVQKLHRQSPTNGGDDWHW